MTKAIALCGVRAGVTRALERYGRCGRWALALVTLILNYEDYIES